MNIDSIKDILPERMKSAIGVSGQSSSMRVFINEIEHNPDNSYVKISFTTPDGRNGIANLNIGHIDSNSEVIKFLPNNTTKLSEVIGNEINVNLSELPQFIDCFENTPTEFIISAANTVDHLENKKDYESMEELLYERFRHINGISDSEAKQLAKDEALDIGDLEALNRSSNTKIRNNKA